MLYKENDNVYVFANNKYYKVKLEKDKIVAIMDGPQKEVKYKLNEKAYKVSAEDAIKALKKGTLTREKEEKDGKNSVLN